MATLVEAEITNPAVDSLKVTKPYNPLASPGGHYDGDTTYKYANYKPVLPKVSWPPLEEQPFTERGTFADPSKPNLLKGGAKIRNLTPAIGAEVTGLDLRQLTDAQKDELALLVAERGAVFLRNQEASIHELLSLGRYYGPLHKHSTTGIPKEPGLEEVHVVYADKTRRPDASAYTTLELWHADVTNEMQPPGTTIFKVLVSPEYGGDTIWASGYALYSSLSPYLQAYLESLSAVHSGVQQAEGARAGGGHVRREPVENVHPLVRVHPATGLKSVFVNPGFTRRIVGVPKAESEAILNFLYTQIAQNPGFQVRWSWKDNDVVLFDNRTATHAATLDFYPAQRHALRVTAHSERPLSVKAYEEKTGKKALDWQKELNKALGIEDAIGRGEGVVRSYAD